ncbi:hypothetical protein RFM23_20955 [Mesorhizobium abyssinicae]|uniref:Peptidase M48 domain-containing protein n=1 Tax=Mesorhizobium abyssinicae TaxID=1209958 RepID=A0ABU5AS31_9HYPH|nr:hypothetical protein [Mesorhizobium abyssinicae]MDX8540093.1 hypothetical protein [Mesorhizobium abyssinicae]
MLASVIFCLSGSLTAKAGPQDYEALRALVGNAMKVIHSRTTHEFVARFQGVDISFNLYNSRFNPAAVYKHNCVATPSDEVVDCDLGLADELISEFKLAEMSGSQLDKETLRYYQEYIIEWILAHEIGHVVLRHGRSDFADDIRGFAVFDAAAQQRELSADSFAVDLVAVPDSTDFSAFGVVLTISNSLMRKSVCPETYPKVCSRMPAGVGLIYDYANGSPIKVGLSGSHPAYTARFLRLLYLIGKDVDAPGLKEEASGAIELLQVETNPGTWEPIKNALLKK